MTNLENHEKPFRVLCLDGGGMRGLYTAVVIQTLIKRFCGDKIVDFGKYFDLIVGTSTGAILACAINAGISLDKVINLYVSTGPIIFKNPIPTNKKIYSIVKWFFSCLHKPSANIQALRTELNNIFGDENINQLYQRRNIALCIPSVTLTTHKARVFKTPHYQSKSLDNNFLISDICLASSAAPMILPIAGLKNRDLDINSNSIIPFVDGGLWANNPVLIGLIEALEILELTNSKKKIEILSIGTCSPPSGSVITYEDLNQGLSYWKLGTKALEVSLEAQASGHANIATFLAKHFTSLGKEIEIHRLPQKPPSSDQMSYLGLDKADKKSLEVLQQLGALDGNEAHSIAHSGATNPLLSKFLNNLFTDIKIDLKK